MPANPLNVTTAVDRTRSVISVVEPATGGTLEARAADGTRYRLRIYPNTLQETTRITMTPIVSISARGKTYGANQIYAVLLEPSGLEFTGAAKLETFPTKPIPVAARAHFDFEGDGGNVAMMAPYLKSKTIVQPVWHFSGSGFATHAAQLGIADAGDFYDLIASQVAIDTAERRLQHAVANILSEERIKQLKGEDNPEFFNKLQEAWKKARDRFIEEVLKPQLQLAVHKAADCDKASQPIRLILGLERQEQLLGLSEGGDLMSGDTEMGRLFREANTKAFEGCWRESMARCMATGDVGELMRRNLGIQRQNQILGGELYNEDENMKRLVEFGKVCGRYELWYRTSGKLENKFTTQSDLVEGVVAAAFDPDEGILGGVVTPAQKPNGSLTPWQVRVACGTKPAKDNRYSKYDCIPVQAGSTSHPSASARTGLNYAGYITVKEMTLASEADRMAAAIKKKAFVDNLMLYLSMPVLRGTIHMCIQGSSGSERCDTDSTYDSGSHFDRVRSMLGGDKLVRDWQPGAYPVMFRKRFSERAVDGDVTESHDTELEFRHKPAQWVQPPEAQVKRVPLRPRAPKPLFPD